MKRFIRHTTRVGNWLWYSAVSLLLLLAVSLSLMRVLLPELDENRKQVEEWVAQFVGQPVTITTLEARLLGLAPSLILHDVALMSSDGDHAIARFEKVHISLDLLDSLFERQLVLDELTVLGARIEVVRQIDGTYTIQGVSVPAASDAVSNAEDTKAVLNWLFSQGRLAIKESELVWRDLQQNRSLILEEINLELENEGDAHRLYGAIDLPRLIGEDVMFAMEFQGPADQPEVWQGNTYFKLVGLQPTRLLGSQEIQGWQLTDGELDLELWGQWAERRLQRLEGTVDTRSVAVARKQRSERIAQLSGRLLWLRHKQGWDLDVDRLILMRTGEEPQPARLHIEHHTSAYTRVQLNRLDLGEISPLVSLAVADNEKNAELLERLQPRGEATNLFFEISEGELGYLQAGFAGLGINAWQKIPGIDGARGRFFWHQGKGDLAVESYALTLHLPRLFREPLEVDRLEGTVGFDFNNADWSISSERIELVNKDIKAEVALLVSGQEGTAPYIDLNGHFRDGDANSVPRYLPARIMSPKTVAWLDQAFRSGRVVSGQVQYKGRGGEPFRNGPGLFRVDFKAEEVELAYHPEWPHLTNIHADVVFEGMGMTIGASSARLLKSRVGAATVSIKNFRRPRLMVNGQATVANGDAFRLLRDTQLAKMGGDATRGMTITGVTKLELDLDIPLSAVTRSEKALVAAGKVHFNNNRITLPQNISLSGVTGILQFNNGVFKASDITGMMFDGPVGINVETIPGKVQKSVVSAAGEFTAGGLQRELAHPLFERLSGKSRWQATLTIPHGDRQEGTSLTVRSDLIGISMRLPQPFGKSAVKREELRLDIGLAGAGERMIGINYGERFAARLELSQREGEFLERGAIHFGKRRPQLSPGQALRITGSLAALDLSEWLALFSNDGGGMAELPIEVDMEQLQLLPFHKVKGEGMRFSRLPTMDILINDFSYNDVKLGRLRVEAKSYPGSWRVEEMRLDSEALVLQGNGRWQDGPDGGKTVMELSLQSDDFGSLMKHLGFASVITKGKADAKGVFNWQGGPNDFGLSGLNGEMSVNIEEGEIEDIEPGAGRLLGLFSLDALPRRLALDFTDITDKGLKFSEIKGDIDIRNGDAYTENLTMKATAANILVTGRTGLDKQDYDQLVSVAPNVSDTAAIASGFVWGPHVAAALLVMQRVFKTNVFGKVLIVQYKITGSWDVPKIERITVEAEQTAG